LGYDI